jgi:pyruvate formate lyase activating enzyme
MKICKQKKIKGRIHSFETFGTQDGPGIRFVVFLQGCLARCLYCQNPDTWQESGAKLMSAGQVGSRLDKCLPYITSSEGGITVSGGEPLLQMDFLQELFSLCKEKRIHTAIDTSAFYRPEDEAKLSGLFDLTGLFILDIKAMDEVLHRRITKRELDQSMRFLRRLEDNKKEYWIRYVLVPGLNDSEQDLKKLGKLVRGLNHCKNFEFLPYHTLGKHKWERLGLAYPLKGTKAASALDIRKAERFVIH